MAEQYVVEIHSKEDWRRVAAILEKAGYLWQAGNPIQSYNPRMPGKVWLHANKRIKNSSMDWKDSLFTKVAISSLASAIGLRWVQEDI